MAQHQACGIVHPSLFASKHTPNAANNPDRAAWSDVLFFTAIDGLYDFAAVNVAASVGRAYADTAMRLALLISPVVSLDGGRD